MIKTAENVKFSPKAAAISEFLVSQDKLESKHCCGQITAVTTGNNKPRLST